jgi:hypothetical protein
MYIFDCRYFACFQHDWSTFSQSLKSLNVQCHIFLICISFPVYFINLVVLKALQGTIIEEQWQWSHRAACSICSWQGCLSMFESSERCFVTLNLIRQAHAVTWDSRTSESGNKEDTIERSRSRTACELSSEYRKERSRLTPEKATFMRFPVQNMALLLLWGAVWTER